MNATPAQQLDLDGQPAMSRSLTWSIGAMVIIALYFTAQHSYLLFHTLSELFSVAIGCGIFMMAWTARRFIQNNYLLLLGTAFLFIAILDLAHTLSYKGMGVFPALDANPATQLWIAARFTEAVSLLIAPFVLRRRMSPEPVLLAYALITTVILLSVFAWKIFPVCYVEGSGLTSFKRGSEYVICLVLLAAMGSLYAERRQFDRQVLRMLLWAIGLTICSELAFTSYVSVYGKANLLGHLFKIIAFFLVYKAIIETGLTKPHALLLRQLSQSEERYRLLFDFSPDGVFAVDSSGRFRVVNPACERLTGYSATELQGRTFMDICAPDQLARTVDHFKSHLARADYDQLETALIRKDGQRIEVWVAGKPLTSDGRISAMLCTVKDISERKRFQSELERQVRERTAKLQELVEELEHFSYTITHDMRAPLRSMRGFAGLLQESCAQDLNEEQRSHLRNITISAGRMDALITDALHYSKTVRQELLIEPVDTRSLLQGMLDSYPQFQPPRAEIVVEEPIPRVLANKAGLTQCFSNLLGNAVKFVGPGNLPKVRVWAERRRWQADPGAAPPGDSTAANHSGISPGREESEVIRIWFEDNGIGIPQQAQTRLFQMFQRVSKDYEGTGIGLALVRKVTGQMGGRLGVESELGKGSRFWLEFRAAN